MEPTEFLLKLVTVFALLTLLLPSMRNALIEAPNEFGNNFRGGPPTPMHRSHSPKVAGSNPAPQPSQDPSEAR
jgi:hypothetical protein